jgi:hypothetical protein
MQNISGNHATAWWQKLAADFPSFAHHDKLQEQTKLYES